MVHTDKHPQGYALISENSSRTKLGSDPFPPPIVQMGKPAAKHEVSLTRDPGRITVAFG